MPEPPRLLVLYGSQTFTAQEIAERLWRTTKALGFRGPVLAMDDYPIQRLIHEEFALFICATAGDGDEPDNMKRFWKFLLRKNLPTNSLVKLKFGVLGLGDSSYSKFNFAGKKLHKRLVQLGASPLLDIGLCDYQHDLGHEAEMTPWFKQFCHKLQNFFPQLQIDSYVTKFTPRWKVSLIKDGPDLPKDNVTEDIYFAKGIKDHFVHAETFVLDKNIRTTDETHFQDVRLLTFTTKNDTKVEYGPGDNFNIRPRNCKEDIDDLFDIFKTHNLDIQPHHRLLVEECHEGPQRAALIGGFSGGANTQSSQDDEYRYAGVEDPKIMVTTSREPSARLKMFVKELRLIFPNSQRMNRGGYEMSQLIHACRANEVTDFIIVHEHRGVPDALVICHLPYGPTASFTLSGVVMRHDIPDIGPMSEQYPHLVFHNFKTDLDMPVPDFLKQPLTLYELAEQYWDLKFYPTQYVFSLLALVSGDKLERDKCIELSTAQGQEDWLNYCRRPKRTVLEVLHDFHKSVSKLTIEVLFELFSPIKPRSFSIASSCLPSGGRQVELLLAVVKYYSKLKKPRLGLCSNWLKDLKVGSKVYAWLKKGTIQFPKDTSTPLILIGPGTGLAPFRSLIQQRTHLNTADKHTIHLFFGCRYKERDFHCREELEKWVEDGRITLYCAFSRDQEEKIYVQYKITEHGSILRSLIMSENAYIFISGNSKNMPDNVREALGEVIGKGEVKALEEEGRLQVETW